MKLLNINNTVKLHNITSDMTWVDITLSTPNTVNAINTITQHEIENNMKFKCSRMYSDFDVVTLFDLSMTSEFNLYINGECRSSMWYSLYELVNWFDENKNSNEVFLEVIEPLTNEEKKHVNHDIITYFGLVQLRVQNHINNSGQEILTERVFALVKNSERLHEIISIEGHVSARDSYITVLNKK